jgi:hypothetical protein
MLRYLLLLCARLIKRVHKLCILISVACAPQCLLRSPQINERRQAVPGFPKLGGSDHVISTHVAGTVAPATAVYLDSEPAASCTSSQLAGSTTGAPRHRTAGQGNHTAHNNGSPSLHTQARVSAKRPRATLDVRAWGGDGLRASGDTEAPGHVEDRRELNRQQQPEP